MIGPPEVLTSTPQGSVGLGLLILGVGVLMAVGAGLSLRSIWGSQPADSAEPPRSGPIPPAVKPLRTPAVGDLRTRFRLLLSFDFGCLAIVSMVMLILGLILIFRGVGV